MFLFPSFLFSFLHSSFLPSFHSFLLSSLPSLFFSVSALRNFMVWGQYPGMWTQWSQIKKSKTPFPLMGLQSQENWINLPYPLACFLSVSFYNLRVTNFCSKEQKGSPREPEDIIEITQKDEIRKYRPIKFMNSGAHIQGIHA